jgi:peptide/nickel transport system substrate-binding protein
LSPTSVTKDGNTKEKIVVPVGTGAYRFDSYAPGDGIKLSRNDDYWGDEPYYAKVSIQIVPEASSRESMLRSGQAQLITAPPLASIRALDEESDITVVSGSPARTLYGVFNTQTSPFNDKLVRQALNYAVDRNAIIEGVMHGTADEAVGPLAPALSGGCTMGQAYGYDPDKARELLAEAGVRGLQIEFGAPTGKYAQAPEIAQAIAGYLKDVGVEAKVTTMDWPTYVGKVTSAPDQNFNLHILGWAASYVDPQQPMSQFQSDQAPPNGLATSYYMNSQVDNLLKSAAQEIDAEKRSELYCEAQKIVWDDAPFLFLWVQQYPVAFNSSLTGIGVAPNEYFDTIHAKPAS